MHRLGLLLAVTLAIGACNKTQPPASMGNLTVGAYCGSFCGKLCGTCGLPNCPDTCKFRCFFGRPATMVLDGKDPKVALARTTADLQACLDTISPESCPAIMAGKVPPACFTIQH
jgi:hypothetical protein